MKNTQISLIVELNDFAKLSFWRIFYKISTKSKFLDRKMFIIIVVNYIRYSNLKTFEK